MKKIMARWWWLILPAAALAVFGAYRARSGGEKEKLKSFFVKRGDLRLSVEASGTVEPKNKVEILPPVSGRIEEILADQGRRMKKGAPLARMSSTDRAALLDAALAQGPEEYEHWKNAYRPTPILAPVRGLIIAREVVEGQTVNAGKVLFTMADRLILRARVDESDIRNISIGQAASAVADAFPDERFRAKVGLVDYQSKDVGGVSAYTVELEPVSLPQGLRSGMTVRVDFLIRESTGVLVLPVSAVQGASESEVELNVRRDGRAERVRVQLGFAAGSDVEIRSGLENGDEVLVAVPSFGMKDGEAKKNPFDPFGGSKKRKRPKKGKVRKGR